MRHEHMVTAYAGPYAEHYLGGFTTTERAVTLAGSLGYSTVHITYSDGETLVWSTEYIGRDAA